MRDGEPASHGRAHVGLTRFDRSHDSRGELRALPIEGKIDEFPQQRGLGVAAERNANALRW
jgi:hypothetical protein